MKEGRMEEGRKGGRKEGRKGGRKEGRTINYKSIDPMLNRSEV